MELLPASARRCARWAQRTADLKEHLAARPTRRDPRHAEPFLRRLSWKHEKKKRAKKILTRFPEKQPRSPSLLRPPPSQRGTGRAPPTRGAVPPTALSQHRRGRVMRVGRMGMDPGAHPHWLSRRISRLWKRSRHGSHCLLLPRLTL